MRKRMEAPPPVSGATLLEVTPSTPGRLRRRSVNSLSNRIASGSLGYEVEGRFTTKTRSLCVSKPGLRSTSAARLFTIRAEPIKSTKEKAISAMRSEERRVGKECRSQRGTEELRKKYKE